MRAILRAAAASVRLPILSACSTSGPAASPEPSVPVGGAASDIAALNGRWEGRYSSVQAQGGDLSGALSAYVDPDCQCQVTTTFRGRREGDAVRGTFTTARTGDPDKKSNGTWSVQRSNRPAEKKN